MPFHRSKCGGKLACLANPGASPDQLHLSQGLATYFVRDNNRASEYEDERNIMPLYGTSCC